MAALRDSGVKDKNYPVCLNVNAKIFPASVGLSERYKYLWKKEEGNRKFYKVYTRMERSSLISAQQILRVFADVDSWPLKEFELCGPTDFLKKYNKCIFSSL